MTNAKKMIGAGIGLAAITAVGTYFLRGRRGAKNRAIVSGWAFKMKGEILEEMEKIKAINKETYYKLVDETAARYARLEQVGASELKLLKEDLKGAWEHLSRELK